MDPVRAGPRAPSVWPCSLEHTCALSPPRGETQKKPTQHLCAPYLPAAAAPSPPPLAGAFCYKALCAAGLPVSPRSIRSAAQGFGQITSVRLLFSGSLMSFPLSEPTVTPQSLSRHTGLSLKQLCHLVSDATLDNFLLCLWPLPLILLRSLPLQWFSEF